MQFRPLQWEDKSEYVSMQFLRDMLPSNINIFQSQTFLIKIYDILKNNILTCSCRASIENWLLLRYASRSSLLYSGFWYTIEIPLQPYKIQLYTFRVQGLACFLPRFPDYNVVNSLLWSLQEGSYSNQMIKDL